MTIELSVPMPYAIQPLALDTALRAACGANLSGLSTYGKVSRPISVWFNDGTPQATIDLALPVVQAHDPVFLTADKLAVAADGVDIATIAVAAPKTGAAPVTLQCKKPDGTTINLPVTLAGGLGTIQFRTALPGDYAISVLNPGTRTTDQLTIKGV
jgi:hypothetical protein